MMDAKAKLLVIGHGMVGQRFLEELVDSGTAAASFAITVLGEESRAAYDRVQLSAFFSGKTADDLSVVPPGFMQKHGIDLRLGERAVSIDRARRCVVKSLGAELGSGTSVIE